jgi:hypothetical protein
MAKRQITIEDGSKGRKQVELNLNPVSIQPTISNGGNYRVAVQQTPKTNSALQLAQALKQGVQVYGQAVGIAQDKATKDVEAMSEEDFDTFLNEGLDEESRNIFGYTKAYNQALAKKYYAQEMPKKLQSIASDLHKDPFQYKTPEEFEAAANAAVSGAYEEADELLGGNVFGDQANNALKSVTKSDFLAKQQATYLERLPQITKQAQEEVAFQAFNELTTETNILKTLEQQMANNENLMGKVVGNQVTTKAYLDVLQVKIENGDIDEANRMIEELDSTDEAILNGQGRRKINGVELFNTKENRLRLEQLEDKLETAGVQNYNASLANSKIGQAGIEVELFTLIKGKDGSENKGLAYLTQLEADIAANRSVTIDGVVYDDTVELQGITQFISGAKNNKDLFVHNAKLNFLQQNIGGKQVVSNQMMSVGSLSKMNLEASKLLFSSSPNGVTGEIEATYTQEGLKVIDEFGTEREQLELALVDSLLSNTALSQGDRITEFSKLYPTEVNGKLQDWLTTRLEQVSPAEVTTEKRYITDEREAYIRENYLPSEAAQIIEDEIATAKDAEREYTLFTKRDGVITFNSSPEDDLELVPRDPTEVYKTARDEGFFSDDDKQAKAFNKVFKSFREDPYGSGAKDRAIREFNRSPWFRSLTPLEQAEKSKVLRDKISLYGISLEELIEDKFGKSFKRLPLEKIYGQNIDFSSFPIVINGNIESIIKEVKAYKEDPSKYKNKDLELLASKNNIPLSNLMDAQYSFLTNSRFITE